MVRWWLGLTIVSILQHAVVVGPSNNRLELSEVCSDPAPSSVQGPSSNLQPPRVVRVVSVPPQPLTAMDGEQDTPSFSDSFDFWTLRCQEQLQLVWQRHPQLRKSLRCTDHQKQVQLQDGTSKASKTTTFQTSMTWTPIIPVTLGTFERSRVGGW